MPNMIPLIPSSRQVASGEHNRQPVGTGPFRVEKWTRGDRLVLARHDDYWDRDNVHLDRVVFRVLPDEGSRVAALRAGDIDLAEFFDGQSILRAEGDASLTAKTYVGSGGIFFLLNTRNEHLKHPKVRAAIAHAFDQDLFVRVAWDNVRPTIEHLLGPETGCENVAFRQFDPERSRRLLADYGQPITLEFLGNVGFTKAPALLTKLLGDVGITLKTTLVDANTRVKRVRGRQFDIAVWGTRSSPDMGGQLHAYSHSTSSFNPTSFSDATMDRALDAMRASITIAERQRWQCEVSRLLNESAHIIYAGGWRFKAFARSNVKGFSFQHGLIDARSIWLEKK